MREKQTQCFSTLPFLENFSCVLAFQWNQNISNYTNLPYDFITQQPCSFGSERSSGKFAGDKSVQLRLALESNWQSLENACNALLAMSLLNMDIQYSDRLVNELFWSGVFLRKKKIFLPISIIHIRFSLRRRALLDRVAVLGICCLESRIAVMNL